MFVAIDLRQWVQGVIRPFRVFVAGVDGVVVDSDARSTIADAQEELEGSDNCAPFVECAGDLCGAERRAAGEFLAQVTLRGPCRGAVAGWGAEQGGGDESYPGGSGGVRRGSSRGERDDEGRSDFAGRAAGAAGAARWIEARTAAWGRGRTDPTATTLCTDAWRARLVLDQI